MDTTTNTHFIDHVVDGLRKAADELEKFQLQFALGKMEAHGLYEELKKDYSQYLREAKEKFEQGKEFTQEMRAKYDELLVQLALGKAETLDQFEEQRKKIVTKLHELKVAVTTDPTLVWIYTELMLLLEKLEIQLEILRKEWKPATDRLTEEFTAKKAELEEKIAELKIKLMEFSNLDERVDVFKTEMQKSFEHFKKAFAG